MSTPTYVTVYAVTRHYGGPEEGGWWYDAGRPKEWVILTDPSQADIDRAVNRLESAYPRRDGLGRYSVLGGADWEVHVEDEPPAEWPDHVPHYE